MKQNFKKDLENEFTLLMEFFDHPYKSKMCQGLIVKDPNGINEKKYDIGTLKGMKDYYIDSGLDMDEDLKLFDRIDNFLSSIMNFPNYAMQQYVSLCISHDISAEFEEIDGIINN